ncbi:MAG: hypothetical protein RIM72_22235 [Alphaproteobacteria bacterium]
MAVGLSLLYTAPAFAYLDPGTGSLILQGLIGGIAAGLAVISIYYQKIKHFVRRLFDRSTDQPD